MADWSQMPEDLLRRIARRLGTQFDVLRFRSVCSSWRSSLAPSPNPLRRGRIPIIPHEGYPDDCTELYVLPKRTIFLVGVPRSCDQTVRSGWLVKVWEDDRGVMNLLNPLTSCEFRLLPEDFPRVLDLMNLRVLELGHSVGCRIPMVSAMAIIIIYGARIGLFFCVDNENDFALLRLLPGGTLVMFKSREKRWSPVQDISLGYDDVILFKGEFYAVDFDGSTVVVGLDSSVTLIVQSDFDGWDKRLVESVGELLLVYMYEEEKTTRFKVHKLDREEKVWNEVKDLGDRVLFLGEECTFSASAADLGACKGNCIFFRDHGGVLRVSSFDMGVVGEIGVYDMDSGIIGFIEDYAGYSQLFWPPPDWIVSRTAEPQVRNQLEAPTV
ncbi:LOW QUALITY PROTEIN: F-box protein SKIP23 [Eucalyptus grandis]|uniref:LOW QUALITY PROTEIN: F-box protein SKIP23 n=1 Tax=Eucalyptus grandis TaxID=71139 RepID=UPI00192EC160|nr:LOW QUALITY PROTEIN: F-box protein SKIP23 [Eucalyptus grandis]